MTKVLFFLVALMSAGVVRAQSAQNMTQNFPTINVLANPGFESGINSRHTKTGGAASLASVHGNGVTWMPSAAGQIFSTAQYSISGALVNGPCLGKVFYKTAEATNQYILQATDGSGNLLARTPLAPTGGIFVDGLLPFTCPASGTYALQIVAAATVPTASITWDDEHLGSNFRLQGFLDAVPISARLITTPGAFTYTKGANVRYIKVRVVGAGGGGAGSGTTSTSAGGNGTATTFGPYVTAGGGVGGTYGGNGVGGSGTTITSPAFGVQIGSAPSGPGNGFTSSGPFFGGGAGGNSCIGGGGVSQKAAGGDPDGASGSGGAGGGDNGTSSVNGGSGGAAGGCADIYLLNPPDSITGTVGTGGTFSAGTSGGFNGSSGATGRVYIEEFGTAGGQAYTPATVNWRIDAILTGTMQIPTTMTATNLPVANSGIVLGTFANSAPVSMACTTGVAPSANCGGTNGTVGINFTPPQGGDYQVCLTTAIALYPSNTGNLVINYGIYETSGNTYTTASSPRSVLGENLIGYGAAGTVHTRSYRWCETFSWPTVSSHTVRFMYNDSQNGTATTPGYLNQARFEVTPITQNVPTPVLVGPNVSVRTVTSNTTVVGSDDTIIADTTSNVITVTLPALGSAGNGKTLTVTKTNAGANLVTITGSIAGVTRSTVLHSAGETDRFIYDGATWQWISDSYRTESAQLLCGGTSSVSNQSGNWLTTLGNFSGTGCVVNMASGIFYSTAINCTAEIYGAGTGNAIYFTSVSPPSVPTNFLLYGAIMSSGSNTVSPFSNFGVEMTCRGPR